MDMIGYSISNLLVFITVFFNGIELELHNNMIDLRDDWRLFNEECLPGYGKEFISQIQCRFCGL